MSIHLFCGCSFEYMAHDMHTYPDYLIIYYLQNGINYEKQTS